MNFGDNIILN